MKCLEKNGEFVRVSDEEAVEMIRSDKKARRKVWKYIPKSVFKAHLIKKAG
jgi:hypothetical protein